MFFRRFVDKNWVLVLPLLLLMVSLLPIWLIFGHNVALVVSHAGTFIVLIGVLLYIVFSHSKRRWPHQPWYTRAAWFLTFKR